MFQLSVPRMVLAVIIGYFLFSTLGPSEHAHLCYGFLPENDMHIPVEGFEAVGRGGLTESQFNGILDQVEKVMGPMIAEHGGRLRLDRRWSDGTVNAYADRQGSTFVVTMMGGLARHAEMTPDGFAMVACHEVGHHIAGEPKYSGKWASVEGESDYFAALKCLRFLWENEDNVAVIKTLQVDPKVRTKCNEVFSSQQEAAICMRSSMAGMAGSRMFASMSGGRWPAFDSPDGSQVSQTYESHPQYQCRLDTYFQGAICERDFRDPWDDRNPNEGTCNRADDDTSGLRPLCWYKPSSGGGTDPGPGPGPGTKPPYPALNGAQTLHIRNPNQNFQIVMDARGVSGAVGVLIEVSKPNQTFANPGGNRPDQQNGLFFQAFRGAGGTLNVLPSRTFPGWGRYQIRIAALNQQGQIIGGFSDSSTLTLTP